MKTPGFLVKIRELQALGCRAPVVGARFITDLLDVSRAEFEVISVGFREVRVRRLAWVPARFCDSNPAHNGVPQRS